MYAQAFSAVQAAPPHPPSLPHSRAHTDGNGLEHGFEVGDVIEDAGHKTVEGPALPQQLLCRLYMLFLHKPAIPSLPQAGRVDDGAHNNHR